MTVDERETLSGKKKSSQESPLLTSTSVVTPCEAEAQQEEVQSRLEPVARLQKAH